MLEIKFIKKGLLTCLQDAGRKGFAFYAIPCSGVMDQTAADSANLIAGNPPGSPCIECHLLAPTISFSKESIIALAGADMNWKIDGSPIPMYQRIRIREGGLLSGSASKNGLRSYISIQGVPITDQHFGSYACYPTANLGANKGQYFTNGDVLKWHEETTGSIQGRHNQNPKPDNLNPTTIHIHKGPEFEFLEQASILKLTTQKFIVLPETNRMGARLHGPALIERQKLKSSKAILPGMIQLLPSGQLIVILNDGQTTGGYPRVAYIAEKDYGKFNQIIFNSAFSFNLIS